jgi:hypothetical protein
MNLLVTVLAGPQPTESEKERAATDALATFTTDGFGYFLEQSTRPQTPRTCRAAQALPTPLGAGRLLRLRRTG